MDASGKNTDQELVIPVESLMQPKPRKPAPSNPTNLRSLGKLPDQSGYGKDLSLQPPRSGEAADREITIGMMLNTKPRS